MTYQQEIDLWCDLYLHFNDDNTRHMENALESILPYEETNESRKAEYMHTHNLQCLAQIHYAMDVSEETILSIVPQAKEHLHELQNHIATLGTTKGESLC